MRSRTRPAPRIARTVPVAARLPDPKRNAGHLAFLRHLLCAICAAPPPSEACHIRKGTDGGVATKPHDKWAISMCPKCHAEQHRVGEVEFFSARGIDPYGLAEHLWTKSGDLSAGTRAALRTAMQITSRRAG